MSILKTIYLQHLNGANANMTLDSSGRVGIGNTSPSYPLHVGGEIFSGRSNSSAEGGQISLGRASDNFAHYNIDCYGGSTTPSLRFIDAAVGAVRMDIDSSGRVTMPYQPLASVKYDGASKTSAWVIVYDNVLYNNGSHYNNTNGRFTCPIAGWYRVTANDMSTYATDSPCFLQVLRNGSSVSGIGYGRTAAAAHSHASIDTIVLCAAGDYLQVYSGSNQYGGGYNHATFQLIA